MLLTNLSQATDQLTVSPVAQVYAQEAPKELSVKELVELKAKEQGVDPKLASKIAFCESTWRQFDDSGKPLRGHQNSKDVGVFQINEEYHLAKSKELGFDIYTTEGNIAYGLWLLKNGGPEPWNWSKHCWNK